MGARYLTDLADVVRRAGLVCVEVDGWPGRGRGSGGYDAGRPNHVMAHHTASGPSSDGWPDVNYCTFGADAAPLCNLYLDRGGVVYVCAAGATNTNGSGHDPCGWTPDDSMNSSAVGIEAGNGGTGEEWPDTQLDAYVRLVRALCDAYDIPVGRVHAHFEWAPDRKTDPFGPDRYAGHAEWDMAEFRADVAACHTPDPPPPAPDPQEDDEMLHVVVRTKDGTVTRGPALVGAGYWHYSRSPDQAYVWQKVYGPPRALDNDYDFDTLVRTMALEPDDDRQLGPGA